MSEDAQETKLPNENTDHVSLRRQQMFYDIDIFVPNNKQLLFCFLFFFTIAVCGYLSLMISTVPFRDDWFRYFGNYSVGADNSLRSAVIAIEYLLYFSNVITDAAPFTQLLSCAILAYCACIFLRILKIDTKNKWHVLCFAPVVVNPYLLEVMMFRFDNTFMTFSLLLVTISAYLSAQNRKSNLVSQSLILLISLFVYQAAISVYFTIFSWKFVERVRSGQKVLKAISEMKYWFYTLAIASLVYAPILQVLDYCKNDDGSILAIPYNTENIQIITRNICRYFSIVWNDWSCSTAGWIFFIMLLIFVIDVLFETGKRTKSIGSVSAVASGIFALLLSPSGIYVLLKVLFYEGNENICPRMMYGAGVLISIVYYEGFLLISREKTTEILIKIAMPLIIIWNLMFMNSSSNIMREFSAVRNQVEYDLSKDISETTEKYPQIKYMDILGEMKNPITENFYKLYPVMNRIFPEKWNVATYFRLSLKNYGLAKVINRINQSQQVFFRESRSFSKHLIKTHPLYELFLQNDDTLLVKFGEDKAPREGTKVEIR